MHDSHQTKSLKELVNRFLETSPFQKQLTAAMVRSVWQTTMPKVVCDRTEKLYIHHNKIFLKITSAPLRHELKFNKDKILMMLHEAMPNTVLEDVVFL
ncbi:DciA family protein [Cardinium endosymbiont of Nabis limbatus]|uniref:DciA family protein n=1 Tax=Cardinium endosymbiont of Nabis limbatus TaxID=3066217 RepID=UPI003AF3676A